MSIDRLHCPIVLPPPFATATSAPVHVCQAHCCEACHPEWWQLLRTCLARRRNHSRLLRPFRSPFTHPSCTFFLDRSWQIPTATAEGLRAESGTKQFVACRSLYKHQLGEAPLSVCRACPSRIFPSAFSLYTHTYSPPASDSFFFATLASVLRTVRSMRTTKKEHARTIRFVCTNKMQFVHTYAKQTPRKAATNKEPLPLSL